MAKDYLSLKEVCDELQLNESQVRALVKSGQLDTIEIGGQEKFMGVAVSDYKKKAEGRETVVISPGSKAPAAPKAGKGGEEEETDVAVGPAAKGGKIDLSSIEEEPGADDADQTSVLQPVAEGAKAAAPEEPVFQFEEDDSTHLDTGSKTAPKDKGKISPEAPTIAAEDETKLESKTDRVAAKEPQEEEVVLAEDEGTSQTEMVADILKEEAGTGEEDDSLETVDLAELEGAAEEPGAPAQGSSAETQLVEAEAGEAETIGLDKPESETEEVSGALGVSAERLDEEEEEGRTLEAGVVPPQMASVAMGPGADMFVAVRPWKLGNVLLAASIVLAVFGSFMVICNSFGFDTPVTKFFYDLLKERV
jgi:hypothetical protein